MNTPTGHSGYWSKCEHCGKQVHPADQPDCQCIEAVDEAVDALIERYPDYASNADHWWAICEQGPYCLDGLMKGPNLELVQHRSFLWGEILRKLREHGGM